MATTEIHAIKSTLSVAIDYIINPDKTEEKLYVNSFGCSIENGKKASDELKEKYPFQKVIPNLEKLIEKSREKNEIYKHLISEIKELDYARQSIEDYLKTQKEIQKNDKEI